MVIDALYFFIWDKILAGGFLQAVILEKKNPFSITDQTGTQHNSFSMFIRIRINTQIFSF